VQLLLSRVALTVLVGEETGPVSGPPPPLSKETKTALADSAKADPTGAHVPGKDAGSKAGIAQPADGEKKVKSEKEREETL
jgi:valyl-tRNA synthetase